MRRTRRSRVSNLAAGLITLAVLVPLIYLAFSKHIPFTHGYRITAVFRTAVNIAPKSPVRIAGVEVGKVVSVEGYGTDNAAKVTMEINQDGLPIHQDATLKIRPRLFLEGNFFVDLHPGSPSAADIPENGTIPITQTADPVQIDQVLSTLTQPIRTGLQDLLAGYGTALTMKPTPAQDATQDPIVQGKTAAQALNDTYYRAGPAEKGISIVNQALLGTEPGDLPKLIAAVAHTTKELGASETTLQDFITNLDQTLAIFGAQGGNVELAIARLPGALSAARQGFAGIAATMPGLRTFAQGFTKVSEQLPATYAAAEPWYAAMETLVAPNRLGGIAQDLRVMSPSLNTVIDQQTALARLIDESATCGDQVLLPTFNVKLQDGALSTGQPNYQEFIRALVGLAGVGQNFDGNGTFARLFAGAGTSIVTADPGPTGHGDDAKGRAAEPPLGTSPKYPGPLPLGSQSDPDAAIAAAKKVFKPNVQCSTQPKPDLNGPLSHGPADQATGG